MSGAQCNSPCWKLWMPNLTHRAITLTWTLTLKSQDDHYYRPCYLLSKKSSCFPNLITPIHSLPSPTRMTTAKCADEKGLKNTRRSTMVPPSPEKQCASTGHRKKNIIKKKKEERKSFIYFCLCTADTRRRKVGHLNCNCPDGIEKKTLRPSLLFCVLPSKLLAQPNQSL